MEVRPVYMGVPPPAGVPVQCGYAAEQAPLLLGCAGSAPIAAVPIWMTETQPVPRQRPPMLGEHTDQILAELGYASDEVARLREQAVI
jgi:crotonobetainyl-CoA:carnitine CoA-transferase CaiB-like acyl-CoA transferase